jgi:hypothetical protein
MEHFAMPNDFQIYVKDDATADQVTAVGKALQEIGPGPVQQQPDNFFTATLDRDTAPKDRVNLKSSLNQAADIVIAVDSAPGAEVALDTNYWNRAFTDMIRQTNRAGWGNWTLNPFVLPGAVGILDPVTGSFTRVAEIPDPKIITLGAPEAWVLESSSVRQTEGEVNFKGGYKDPSSGKEVKVGLDVSWTFSKEGSLTSNATMTGRSVVDSFGLLMHKHFDWLLEQARSVGYATRDGGIRQGFGMITQVQMCQGGINIGSLNENSSFSLVGSIDGVNAMTGGGQVDASVKGSYKEVNKSKAFESHLWPTQANTAAPSQIGLVYQFATFHGKLIMPTWIQPVDGFRLIFDNNHGGTYIGQCTVEYLTPDSSERHSKYTSVPGGQVHTLDGIPLDAYDLKIKIHFVAGDDFNFTFDSPISDWLTGHCTVDLSGVWPWGSHAKIR